MASRRMTLADDYSVACFSWKRPAPFTAASATGRKRTRQIAFWLLQSKADTRPTLDNLA